MTQSFVNLGGQPNDGTGDSIRDAFDKVNNNFTEVYSGIANVQSFVNSATYVSSQVASIQNFSTTIANFSATQVLFQGDLDTFSNTLAAAQSTITGLGTSSTLAFNKIGALSNQLSTLTTSTLWNGTWTVSISNTGTLTVPDRIVAQATYFTGAISGTTLTVTNCTAGKLGWEQYIEGAGIANDTFIMYQLTGVSGGNGTYKVSVSQNLSARTLSVSSLFLDASIKLNRSHSIYIQDAHDDTLYDLLIGIKETEGTIHLGSINTNGVSITNNQEYKVESALNTGTFMAVAKVNTVDDVFLGSGNSSSTQILVGGMDTGYGMKLFNGGKIHIPKNLKIGENINDSNFGATLEIGTRDTNMGINGILPASAALTTYRGTATTVTNDEWGSFVYGSRFRGTLNSPLAVKQDDWIMEFGAAAWDGTGPYLNGGGELAWRVDGAVSAGINPSRFELYVTPQGAAGQTIALVIDSHLTVTAYGPIKTVVTTVSGLPSAAAAGIGARAFITNASTTTFNATVTTTGTYMMPVFSNGTDWFIG